MPRFPAIRKLSSALMALPVVLLAPTSARAVCGDGVVDSGEICDDLNTTSLDGCDSVCQPEWGWSCAPATFALDFDEVLVDEGILPNWTLSQDGLTLSQSQNASAAVYGSTLPAPGVTIGFTLAVNTGSDDDYIGWTIGYEQGENAQSSGDWLLFDWKQADQGIADRGLRVWRVTGPITGTGFWDHDQNMTLIAEANTLGFTGWQDNVTYYVEVSYATSGLQVSIDGTEEFNETGIYPTGNFGFYNYSQEDIEYSLVSPLNQSLCSLNDSDGDGLVDLDEINLGTDPNLVDTDGDGIDDLTEVGDPANPFDSDGDGTIDAVDCDSEDPNATTSVVEDTDCDGLLNSVEDVDGDGDPSNDDSDGDGTPNYLDDDSDNDGSLDSEDCAPVDGVNGSGGTEICDGLDNDCNDGADFDLGGEVDADMDGFLSCADCDDTNAAIHPDAEELCDGLDNDCSGGADFDTTGEVDLDSDGSPSCADCDDADAANSPGGTELCDGQDNDCDAETSAEGGEVDADGDRSIGCEDCDDADAANVPGGTEVCDGQDNDCDAETSAEGGEDVSAAGNRFCSDYAAGGCSCQSNLWSGSPSALSPLILIGLLAVARRRDTPG